MSNQTTVRVQVKDTNWGPQFMITIPRKLAKHYEFEKGEEVRLRKNNGRITKGLVIQKKEE